MLVILRSAFPKSRDKLTAAPGERPPAACIVVQPKEASFHLANLENAVGVDGRLTLFFADCGAAAAPFVMYRLKREGFSACRATSTGAGLLVEAIR